MLFNFCKEKIQKVGKVVLFFLRTVFLATKRPFYLSEIVKVTNIITRRCLLPVISVVTPFGMVVALQGINIFKIFGAEKMLSGLVCISLVRELSPGVTSIMVAAQAGSGVTAELGAMRIKEEIDAIELFGVNPLKYLVLPRMIGIMIACVLVNSIATIGGIAGGYFVAVNLKGLSQGAFLANLFMLSNPSDILIGPLKAASYGLIIGIMSSYYGYNVTGGAQGVGKAVNNSVVHSILLFVFLNYFLTTLFFKITHMLGY